MGTMTLPLWVIAVCAVIWTGRMLLTGALLWAAERWPYGTAPGSVKWFARVVSGGRKS